MVVGSCIPAIQQAEAGESFEPEKWSLPWAEIMPLHSSLGDKSETLFQEKKVKEQYRFNNDSFLQIVFKLYPFSFLFLYLKV